MKKKEVLAPAGSMECLKAAFLNGADAVYLGGDMFGARAYANNFNQEQLLEAIDYAHKFDKKVYLTMNTLVKEEEREDLVSFLVPFYEAGIDAVLVQDLGAFKVLKRHFPDLEFHGSTQLTTTGVDSGRFLKKLGIKRLVPARELSLEEIRRIKDATDLDIECFVHGALCYCYSGQCFMSSMIGGRSGNRGRCAGTCRLPFDLYEGKQKINHENEQYLLSPKDLCAIDLLPKLFDAGVDSLKIEGRMKQPEYVAAVTRIYRKYVDLYESGKPYQVEECDRKELLEVFNRGGFTDGYYEKYNGKDMMSLARPNHQGIFVGEISKIKGGTISFCAKEDIHVGDVLEISLKGMDFVELTSPKEVKAGNMITLNGQKLRKLKLNMPIYRTKNQALRNDLKEDLQQKMQENLKGKVIFSPGESVKLELDNGKETVCVTGDQVEVAKSSPLLREQVEKQFRKTGNTDYCFDSLEVILQGDCFLPVKSMKALRNRGFLALEQKKLEPYRRRYRALAKENGTCVEEKKEWNPSISVFLEDENLVETVLAYSFVSVIVLPFHIVVKHPELLEKIGTKDLYLMLPPIVRKKTRQNLEQWKDLLFHSKVAGVVVQNIDEVSWLLHHKYEGKIKANYNLYNYNQSSVEFYKSIWPNQMEFTYPMELNVEELKKLKLPDGELFFYGHMPVMVSAQCQQKNVLGCNHQPIWLKLRDRKQEDFFVRNHCEDCYNVIYNGKPIWLGDDMDDVFYLNPSVLQVRFTKETKQEAKTVLDAVNHCIRNIPKDFCFKQYTKGHFKRGIL